MSAAPFQAGTQRALDALADSMHRLGDVLHALALDVPAPAGPRLVSTTREPEELLTAQQVAALLKVSVASVRRLARRNPRIVRRVGARGVRYDRSAVLAALPKGV